MTNIEGTSSHKVANTASHVPRDFINLLKTHPMKEDSCVPPHTNIMLLGRRNAVHNTWRQSSKVG